MTALPVDTSIPDAFATLRALADAYAEGDEEMVETLVYEIYCDYHISHMEASE